MPSDQVLKALTAAGALNPTDIMYVMVTPSGTPLDRQTTMTNLATSLQSLFTGLTVTALLPTVTITDSTASAHSLTIHVGSNIADLRDSAGSSGSLMSLDLVNNRMGLGTNAPLARFDSRSATGSAQGTFSWDSSHFLSFNVDVSGNATLVCQGQLKSNQGMGVYKTAPTALTTADSSNNSHMTLYGTDALIRLQFGILNASPLFGGVIQATFDNGGGSNGIEPLLLNPLGGKVSVGATFAALGALDVRATTGAQAVASYDGTHFLSQTIDVSGNAVLLCQGSLLVNAPSGIGYATGTGGTVTQATNKSTGVTLNKASGQITMNNATLNASTSVGFTFTNSVIGANDTVNVNIASGGTVNSYNVTVDTVAGGSCHIHVRNVSAGNLGEALVLNFSVGKGVIS